MSNADKRLSQDGARFIAGWEGLVLRPYNDSGNNATIGIGHLLHFGPVNAGDVARWRGFTERDAIELLQSDVGDVERQIRAALERELEQHEWDAIVSLVFNCGPGVLEGAVGRALNAGDFHGAAEDMLAWCHVAGHVEPGLLHRREAEGRLLLQPDAPYVPTDERRWEAEWDHLRGRKGIRARARRRALQRAMTRRRKLIWRLAQKTGWATLDRAHRYRELLLRTEG